MRFVHISDNHLGFRQFGLFERENDFYDVFDRAVEEIIKERPDFVIHSGDLFEASRPPTRALLLVQRSFSRLKDENIPIYAIPGNHDTIMRKNTYPPQILYEMFGLKLISKKNPFYVQDGVFIGGSPYISKYYSKSLKERIKFLGERSKDYDKSILVLHQAIDKYLPYEFELKIGDLPKCFDYYALGHIHNRIIDDFGRGRLAYSGSTEIWKIDELKNYKKKGKGFYLVDLDGDIPDVQGVNLEMSREVIEEKIEFSEFKEDIGRLKRYIEEMETMPILYLTVKGDFDRSFVHKKLMSTLSNISLHIRVNYDLEDDIEREEYYKEIAKGSLNIKDMIKMSYGEGEEKKEYSTFAVSLFDLLSSNKIEDAKELTEKFYEGFK
ncbi:MAG: DNA repair exonuclease [Candidatus Methanolliviera hydrocarbonicum]|uniref:DNA double-strand break repair protein Mre11 n=1 Tax=Candidatus Methanolliviera hydrocarbonicum TaxID=2491085 RepID=A0A520KUS0_9EURY|nr:MAG: DNA repair exonuclease [Candidatus Methanolliviera hydrocarbonicum]